jgi:hypothetical protein
MNNNEWSNEEITNFKSRVSKWIHIDSEIIEHQNKIKELRKLKKKTEPEITEFMISHNIKNLNSDGEQIRCNERNTKESLNKNNIRNNLKQVISDEFLLDKALDLIMNNRNTKTKIVLTKPKKK